jgi:putative sigma-54 modulation protein
MNINIRAMHMELTPAIREYVEEKFSMLEKYAHNIMLVEIDLGKNSNHHQKGEVFTCSAVIKTTHDVFKIEKEEEDLYKAIDKVKDHFREVLVTEKEKIRDEHRKNSEEV